MWSKDLVHFIICQYQQKWKNFRFNNIYYSSKPPFKLKIGEGSVKRIYMLDTSGNSNIDFELLQNLGF